MLPARTHNDQETRHDAQRQGDEHHNDRTDKRRFRRHQEDDAQQENQQRLHRCLQDRVVD